MRNIEGQIRVRQWRFYKTFQKPMILLADSNKAYLREQVAGVFFRQIFLSAIVKDLNSNTQVYSQGLDTINTSYQ